MSKPSKARAPRRRSKRGNESVLSSLASHIVKNNGITRIDMNSIRSSSKFTSNGDSKHSHHHQQHQQKRILVFTGAGISVPSGIRPFRGKNGLWNETLWTNATREAFRKNPLEWYNSFWLKNFPPPMHATPGCYFRPNQGHEALAQLAQMFPDLYVITQNVDGLHSCTDNKWDWEERLIEAHGRLGLFKCIPDDDSDTSDDETDDEDEVAVEGTATNRGFIERRKRSKVRLGSYRKSLEWKRRYHECLQNQKKDGAKANSTEPRVVGPCWYEMEESIPPSKIEPLSTRTILNGEYQQQDDGDYENTSMKGTASSNKYQQGSTSKIFVTNIIANCNSNDIKSSKENNSKDGKNEEDKISQVPQRTMTTSSCPANVPISTSNAIAATTSTLRQSSIDNKMSSYEKVAIVSTTSSCQSSTSSTSSSEDDEDKQQVRSARNSIELDINIAKIAQKPEMTTLSTKTTAASAPSTNCDISDETKSTSKSTRKRPRRSKECTVSRKQHHKLSNTSPPCQTITPKLKSPPLCPSCKRPCLPQALLFDEGYHSHSHYQFQKMEEWISTSAVLVFIGTSFAVNITDVALDYARENNVPVYNFNIEKEGCGGNTASSMLGRQGSIGILDVHNIVGDVEVTLPMLLNACLKEIERNKNRDTTSV